LLLVERHFGFTRGQARFPIVNFLLRNGPGASESFASLQGDAGDLRVGASAGQLGGFLAGVEFKQFLPGLNDLAFGKMNGFDYAFGFGLYLDNFVRLSSADRSKAT
jgi:hypothetical protein